MACQLGALPIVLDAATHDRLVAVTSHLPRVLAGAVADLVETHPERDLLLRLVGGGYRDTTRTAASNPALWADILDQNRIAVIAAIDEFLERLASMRSALAGGAVAGALGVVPAMRRPAPAVPQAFRPDGRGGGRAGPRARGAGRPPPYGRRGGHGADPSTQRDQSRRCAASRRQGGARADLRPAARWRQREHDPTRTSAPFSWRRTGGPS
ncbi:MAG: prephenate dehydrogenase dimerization domain-containing protein [Acidimicrobiales bacterium]